MRKYLLGLIAVAAIGFACLAPISQASAQWGGYYGGGHYGYGHGHRSYYGGYNRGHYDYHGPSFQRHRNHYHYVPGHYDYHRGGHGHYGW